MPNWCNNTIVVSDVDEERIDEFEKFLNDNDGKNWFDFFAPCPKELLEVGDVSFHEKENEVLLEKYGHADWYSWSVANWGCKWNCDANDWERDGNSISFWFDSPWGPPIELYKIMYSEGYDIDAHFLEEGMCFVGRFVEGEDESYSYSDLDSLDDIPESLVENWNLRGMLEDQMEWNSEDEDVEDEHFTNSGTKDWVRGLLKEGVVDVEFEKSDGTIRNMKCTLIEDKIPTSKLPKGTGKQESDDVQPVFDVEKQEWRSFRWDSVKSVNFTLGDDDA